MSFTDIISGNREKFQRYNTLKFERFQELFPNKNISKVINSIPLLLSVNDKKIPGYVEGDVPLGIVNYIPDEESVKFLKTRFRLPEIKTEKSKPFIHMLAVMGSIGTIAYTKKSDFDYWVCVDRHGFQPDHFKKFQIKTEAITKWIYQESKIEVNLFINEIDKIKKNIFADNEADSLGTTIGALLKDEFYRSSIIISGKIPFWWVIPRFINDSEYSRLYDTLPDELKERDYIDLGNLFVISKEDFLGAALFQIIKSLGNPFKSIIKIGVLEKYLFDSDYSPLLCHKVKTNVLRGNLDNSTIDSYILMFEEVYDFYSNTHKDPALLKVLQENLYLKINPQLSKYTAVKESKNIPYNVGIMIKYVNGWKWTADRIHGLDDFNNWDYNRIMVFWNEVKKFILISYQNIARELPSLNIKEKISESDFQLLSRKIQTYFSTRENKIDQYVTFKDTPHESILYIDPVSKGLKDVEWKLSKNITCDRDEMSSIIIKTDTSLVKLLAWTSINRIFNPKFSRIKIQSGYHRMNQNLVVDILSRIWEIFSDENQEIRNDYYLKPAFNLANILIINFNSESQDTIKNIHHIYNTSWGESCIDEYDSALKLPDILGKILDGGAVTKRSYTQCCAVLSQDPTRKYYRGIEKFFQGSYEFIVQNIRSIPLSMVTRFENGYLNISRDENMRVDISSYKSMSQLLSSQSLKPRKEIEFNFYGDDEHIKILNYVISRKKDNYITIAYEERKNYIFIYLMNERGNLFTFIKPRQFKEKALASLFLFCKNTISQVNSIQSHPDINSLIPVYRLGLGKDNEITAEYVSNVFEKVILEKYRRQHPVEVEISRYMTEDNFYSIKFDENNKTEFLPFKRISEKIVSFDDIGKSFIMKIKFIDFASEYFSGGTTVYFLEKYRLELLFDRANALNPSL